MLRVLFLFLFVLCAGENAFAQQATLIPPSTQIKSGQDDQADRLSQQIRAEERQSDFQTSGLHWIPWNSAGKNVQNFVIQRDKFYKSLIGNGSHVDIAVYDMDGNNQPDIVLFFWDHCGTLGCLYKIYYDKEDKVPNDFFGWDFTPYKKGVMLDHAYFSLR